MFTTELGNAAYEGKRDIVKSALEAGVDWSIEKDYLLSSAIFGLQWDIARDILRAGMPVTEKTYSEIFYYADHSLLDELPKDPAVMDKLTSGVRKHSFFSALVDGDLNKVTELFRHDWINEEMAILGGGVKMRPIHYAARSCHWDCLEFLLQKGADVNTLTSDGQSALTLVTKCPVDDKNLRRDCYQLIADHGGKMVPPVKSWFDRWCYSRGTWRRN